MRVKNFVSSTVKLGSDALPATPTTPSTLADKFSYVNSAADDYF